MLFLTGRGSWIDSHERLMAEHLCQPLPNLRIVPAPSAHLTVVACQRRKLSIQHLTDRDDRRDLLVGPSQPLESLLLAAVVLGRGRGVPGPLALLFHRCAHSRDPG